MNPFYASIMFLGIMLIVIALVWILYDRKKSLDYTQALDQKKDQLVNIIGDAEQMIDELNKFSDYIVTQMDRKHEEINTDIQRMEERVSRLSSYIEGEMNYAAVQPVEKVVNGGIAEMAVAAETAAAYTVKPPLKPRDNVIPLNSKHKEILQLMEKGLDETEIAKRLSVGKGEIQLILELYKK